METLNMVREDINIAASRALILPITLLFHFSLDLCVLRNFFSGFLDDCGEVIALFKLQNLRL